MERSTWVKLADKLPDEPQVAGLSDAAFRLHITALCYCSRHLTDGLVPDAMISRWGVRGAQRAANELVESGLWSWRGDGDYAVVGYLDAQRSRAEVEAISAKRAESGKRGGIAKAKRKQASSKLPSKAVAEVEDRVQSSENSSSSVTASPPTAAEDEEIWQALADLKFDSRPPLSSQPITDRRAWQAKVVATDRADSELRSLMLRAKRGWPDASPVEIARYVFDGAEPKAPPKPVACPDCGEVFPTLEERYAHDDAGCESEIVAGSIPTSGGRDG